MKYGNIAYSPRSNRLTIGDDMQLLAVQELYRQIGIKDEDVIEINYGELATYSGEYVVLPISFPLLAYTPKGKVTCFSERIIPVFLGTCILDPHLCEEDIEYLKRFAPIGCRDVYTLNNLRDQGVPAYLGGCITLTLPKRAEAGLGKKVICVDVPERLRGLIPEELRNEAEFLSHTFYADQLNCSPSEIVRDRYDHYIKDGKLIITTRLHAALPCFAAGLPVVFLKDEYSYRFAGIDKVVQFYSKEDFGKIDWNPAPLEFEEYKAMAISVAEKRIKQAYEDNKDICDLSYYLENKDRPPFFVEFLDNTKEFIQENWSKDEPVKYVLWGITQTANAVQDYIEKEYPLAKLVGVVDRSKRIDFHGVQSCPKEEISVGEDCWYIVCAFAAVGEASEWFDTRGITTYFQTASDDYTFHPRDAFHKSES